MNMLIAHQMLFQPIVIVWYLIGRSRICITTTTSQQLHPMRQPYSSTSRLHIFLFFHCMYYLLYNYFSSIINI